jgi:hypothetical protein
MVLKGRVGEVFTTRLTYFNGEGYAFLFVKGYRGPPIQEKIKLTWYRKMVFLLAYTFKNLLHLERVREAWSCRGTARGEVEFLEAKYYTLLDGKKLLTWTWFPGEPKVEGQGKNIEHPSKIPAGESIESEDFEVVEHRHFDLYPEYYVSKFTIEP